MFFVVERTAGDVVRYKTMDVLDASNYMGRDMTVDELRRAGEGRNNANVSYNGRWAVFYLTRRHEYLW